MDEFHFYADPDRGWAWQVPLLELPQAQFLLMSATLGDVSRFADDLTRRTGRPTAVVNVGRAPGAAALLLRARRRCTRRWRTCSPPTRRPIYVVHFTQAAALERAQALMSVERLHPGGEGRDRRADRRLPVHRRLRQDAVPAGPARHRRAPRRDAAQVPAAGRDAGPGRAAQGHLRHRHPRRRHQRADPHGAVHRAVQVRRHAGPGCCRRASSTRSPAGPAGPASTPPAPSSCRPPSTWSRTSRPLAKAGDDPKKRRKVVAQEAAGGLRLLGRADLRAAGRRRARAADVAASRSRHAMLLERHRPARATRSPRCATC